MKGLSARERKILVQHYLEGRTCHSIAIDQGVSEPRISQIRKAAIEKLRGVMGTRS